MSRIQVDIILFLIGYDGGGCGGRHRAKIILKTIFRKCANWQIAGSSWLKKVPYGFGDLLRTIDYKYDSGRVLK